jgi:hypothetical protein
MSAPATCIACNKPFAENRELAAIPDASKVAFDPAHRRVWRICAPCGEWNLLGAEAAAAALPELEARFAAVTSSSAPELGFAPARASNRLELLRVGRAELVSQDDGVALRLRKEVSKRVKGQRWFGVIAGVVFVSWCAFVLLTSHGSMAAPSMILLDYSMAWLVMRVGARMRGRKASRSSWLINCALVVAGLGLVLRFGPQDLRPMYVGFLSMIPAVFLIEISRSRVGVVRLSLSDGTKLRLAENDLPRITLSWTSGATDVALHDLPKGRSLSGPDVAPVFRRVAPWSYKRGLVHLITKMSTVTENAYNLLSTVGGLAGLLHALEGFRRDNDGRVLIADLPMVYLVALDLALSDKGAGSESGALRDRAIEAAAVAHEAEELDRR